MFAVGVAMLIPIAVTAVQTLPTAAVPIIYGIVVIFLYLRGNTLRESVLFITIPTLFVVGVAMVALSRSPEYGPMFAYAGFVLSGFSALAISWFLYGGDLSF